MNRQRNRTEGSLSNAWFDLAESRYFVAGSARRTRTYAKRLARKALRRNGQAILREDL
jgi:hypothetical protein